MAMRRMFEEHLPLVARAGYASRGVIYVIVGSLAAVAAWGSGGKTTDSRGALVELLGAPFGNVLLLLVAIGLVCYSIWRAVQAILDADGHGTDLRALAIRGGLAVSAITHLVLAFFALSLIFDWGTGGGSGDASREWTARLLAQPFGPWLVALVGIAIIGAGIAHAMKGWNADFEKRFDMNADERRLITPISRFGLIARGAVFLLIGGFFLVAAVQHDPSEARGLSGTLELLQAQPYGWFLLAVVAVGLAAFGVYSLLETFYRRIGTTGIALRRM